MTTSASVMRAGPEPAIRARGLVKAFGSIRAVDGLRQVFIRGADLSVRALQVDLVVLAVIALFFAVIASLTIRRDVV